VTHLITLSALLLAFAAGQQAPDTRANPGLEFIDTSFENASPLWYEFADDGSVQIHLLYDHERSSPNRAAGHIHFLLQGRAGASLTLEFRNLDNVWNGQPGSVARELKTLVVSEDGREWKPMPTESLPGDRVRLTLTMPGSRLYVARTEPYRLSDLDRLLDSIRNHPLVRIESIGKTAGGRALEIVHIGNPDAPYRAFLRARAHPWESGSSWVVEGLIQRLLRNDTAHAAGAGLPQQAGGETDDDRKRWLSTYSVSILPMGNKDGVALGMTRFNLQGTDLNRNWNRPADPAVAPENAALEKWLERTIAAGRPPHLAIELHNDGSGRLHISRPPMPILDRHLARMAILEQLLRAQTWFTEGSTNAAFRNSGTLGDGWLERYGIDAVVHEFNCNWIAGLKDYPSARHWKAYGEGLAGVLREYFLAVEP
jgi:Zinc carboxypeptidase